MTTLPGPSHNIIIVVYVAYKIKYHADAPIFATVASIMVNGRDASQGVVDS